MVLGNCLLYRTQHCEEKPWSHEEKSAVEKHEQIHQNDESVRKDGLCGGSGTGISIAVPVLGSSQI